jgi:hypothetical protein
MLLREDSHGTIKIEQNRRGSDPQIYTLEYTKQFDINAERRQSMQQRRHSREEADALTHPSGNFRLPYQTIAGLGEAEPIIAEYCARMCDWGIARFPATSVESRFLRVMQSLSLQLASVGAPENADQGHWTALLDLARQSMKLRLDVRCFSLSIEIGGVQYDTTDLVHCVHAAAVSALLGLYLSN